MTIEYSDFSKGEYGKLGGSKAPPGSFHASNMIVTSDGYLTPRAGLKDITPVSMPNGKLLGLSTTDTPGKDGLFIIGNIVYLFDLFDPASPPTSIGTLTVTPAEPVSIKAVTTDRYFSVPGDKVYKVDPVAATLTGITGSPGGHDVATYDDQLVVAKSESSNQILASVPGDYTDFSDGRFIDVGDKWQVTALFEQRNSLHVPKRRGHHAVTGVIGDPNTQVVRKQSTVMGPLHPHAAAIDANDIVWFWPLFREDIGYFDGSSVRFTSHIGAPSVERDDTVATPPLVRGLAVIAGDLTATSIAAIQAGSTQMMLLNHNGIWTYHTFGTTVSGMICHDPELERIVITDGGGTSTPAKILTTLPALNRPVIATDTLINYGDNSSTPVPASVTFPQHWVAPYRRYPVPAIRIRQITVDFKKYDTGAAASNHFDITVSSVGIKGQNPVTHTFGTPFDESPSASSTSGTTARKSCNMAMELGGGFEVSLSNVRGVSIRSVTVHFESDDKRDSA